jgi:hypothetical protein
VFFDPLGPLRGIIVGMFMLMFLAMVVVVMLGKIILCAIGIAIAIRIALWLRKADEHGSRTTKRPSDSVQAGDYRRVHSAGAGSEEGP